MLTPPASWNAVNLGLYLHWAASGSAGAVSIGIARVLAEYAIAAVPLLLVWGWLRQPAGRAALLQATAAALLALGVNQLIGTVFFEPRPFAIGLGPALLAHAPDSGFPSDHVTVLAAVAVSLLLHPAWRRTGMLLAALAAAVAWARVYLGVHWPLDMVGAVIVGGATALALHAARRLLIAPLLPPLLRLYRWLFARGIQRGWALF
ncbi:phosphatase PAP2 family protein [Thiomonas sp.]|jgi:undecaprenyl-diphosphatase|uniref:phosphatase PAP2 family protein n=1 Tax=Thiomonas sp. TaxID=2047785 RepID=UPI002624EEC6|nr:phosphatase PAP2 family protein [Thiomonas sp.]